MVSRVVPVEPFDLVIFGATGDLSRRKLLPALYHRMSAGQMPDSARVIGTSRTVLTADEFRAIADEALEMFGGAEGQDAETRARFLACLDYVPLDISTPPPWTALCERLSGAGERPMAFYMSVAPRFFGTIAEGIRGSGLVTENTRIVVEKPLGHDLQSAARLNAELAANFTEHQIYRIDHYLGKETVQNLMALRFANALFEPLWSAQHIDHVQITVAESVGIEGRGPYYDGIGAMRDMVQNHLLQLLCLTAMEPPSHFDPDAVRDEKLKVLRALSPINNPHDIVRGQYRATADAGSYLEDAQNPESRTESFVALKLGIANWRWAGVPFYLRTGKRLRARMSEIAIQFKGVPHHIFDTNASVSRPNVLAIRVQPDEGITLSMTIKDPGPGGMRLTGTELDMSFADGLGERMPDAYERLVMDVIRGDQTLFMRGDEVEAAWAWTDPVVESFADAGPPQPYDSGSSGPDDALMLLHRDGRRWREINA